MPCSSSALVLSVNSTCASTASSVSASCGKSISETMTVIRQARLAQRTPAAERSDKSHENCVHNFCNISGSGQQLLRAERVI